MGREAGCDAKVLEPHRQPRALLKGKAIHPRVELLACLAFQASECTRRPNCGTTSWLRFHGPLDQITPRVKPIEPARMGLLGGEDLGEVAESSLALAAGLV